LNLRPSGYEPDELPGCSTPRHHCLEPFENRQSGRSRKNSKREETVLLVLGRPGSDLLSRVLRRSTIGAGVFHGRVRNGIGCSHPAITTRSAKHKQTRSWNFAHGTAVNISNENDQADRAISTGKLHTLLRFHTRPINVVVYHDSQGILVLRSVSRLDAFSGYPFRI
jgi:hypothetical protein